METGSACAPRRLIRKSLGGKRHCESRSKRFAYDWPSIWLYLAGVDANVGPSRVPRSYREEIQLRFYNKGEKSILEEASTGHRAVSCVPQRLDEPHSQVTGRVVIFRGRFEGSTSRVPAGHEAVDEARAANFHSDELVTARSTWYLTLWQNIGEIY